MIDSYHLSQTFVLLVSLCSWIPFASNWQQIEKFFISSWCFMDQVQFFSFHFVSILFCVLVQFFYRLSIMFSTLTTFFHWKIVISNIYSCPFFRIFSFFLPLCFCSTILIQNSIEGWNVVTIEDVRSNDL